MGPQGTATRHCQVKWPDLCRSSQTSLLVAFMVLPLATAFQLRTTTGGLRCLGPVWVDSAGQRALGFANCLWFLSVIIYTQ